VSRICRIIFGFFLLAEHLDVRRLHEYDDSDEWTNDEVRYRTKVEYGEFWVAVHSTATNSGERTELTIGWTDDTAVAVTRRPTDGGFDVFTRTVDDHSREWSNGRPMLEYYEDDAVAVANAADGTRIVANFGDLDDFVCEIYVSDGTKMRTRVGPAIEYCPGDRARKTGRDGRDDKYLVCRRDLTGYEFVDDDPAESRTPSERSGRTSGELSPALVVRTLTPSPFKDRTAGLVDKALSDHFKTLGTLADRLNGECRGQVE